MVVTAADDILSAIIKFGMVGLKIGFREARRRRESSRQIATG